MARPQAPLNDLQLYKSRFQNGTHTESNHLSNHFLTEPYKMGAIINYAMYKDGQDNILSLLTGGVGNYVEVPNREYRWDVYAHDERIVEIKQDVTGTPGVGGLPFEIVLEDRAFEVTDNLVLDDGTQVRVDSEPYQIGNGWCYPVTKTDPNLPNVDPAVLTAGSAVSKDYSTVEEESMRGGGITYQTPFKMTNQLTTLRKTLTVSRSAATDVMNISLPHPENPKKTFSTWVKYSEWEALREWVGENERMYMYSIYNKDAVGTTDIKGETGRPVFHGAGLRQQIGPANRMFYNKLSYGLLEDFFTRLSSAKGGKLGDAKFIALTGQGGLNEFQRALRNEMNSSGVTQTAEGKFITGNGYKLTLEGHFSQVKFVNGIELTVQHFPPYDNLSRNRQLHPSGVLPTESYRFTIMNIGEGGNMIKKVYKKDSRDLMWYIAGSVDPYNGTSKKMSSRSSAIDGYEVNYLSECGIMLGDPRSCGELIYNA